MKDKKIQDLLERLDEAATDGIFALPGPKERPRHNLRALDQYCEKKGIQPSELTEEELKQFEL